MNAAAFAWKRRAAKIGHVVLLAAFVIFTAFPFYLMFITTFKTTLDLVDTHNNPFLFNLPPTLENLDVLFFNTQYGLWVWNTVLVGILVVIITLLLAIPAGYSLARLSGRWGRKLAVAIFRSEGRGGGKEGGRT